MDAATMNTRSVTDRSSFVSAPDRINRRTWQRKSSLRMYRALEGFIDAGERVAFGRVITDARRGRVLDMGVGGGRTARLVLAETSNYIGIDYTPEMIDICRSKFPGVAFELADARDLSRFETASFNLVQFSYNGIDAVDADGRARVLREVLRVLRPGGAFFFSTFNRSGPGFVDTGLSVRKLDVPASLPKAARALAGYVVGTAVGLWRKSLYRKYEKAASDAALRLHAAHDYGILVHATTIAELRDELQATGFVAPSAIIGSDGSDLTGAVTSAQEYFHIIARKPDWV